MDRVVRSQYFQQHLHGLTPQQRHSQLVQQALQHPNGVQLGGLGPLPATETDHDALRKHHRFLRAPEDDAQSQNSWGARLARRYYARLFKEYAIADLSRYKESKIGLRWRTQDEVVTGKGQFTCGAKGCSSSEGLCAYEVNFAYQEDGQQKQALVKLCLCNECAPRLNYRRNTDKQYKRLGASSVFDHHHQQQHHQQHHWEQQQQHHDPAQRSSKRKHRSHKAHEDAHQVSREQRLRVGRSADRAREATRGHKEGKRRSRSRSYEHSNSTRVMQAEGRHGGGRQHEGQAPVAATGGREGDSTLEVQAEAGNLDAATEARVQQQQHWSVQAQQRGGGQDNAPVAAAANRSDCRDCAAFTTKSQPVVSSAKEANKVSCRVIMSSARSGYQQQQEGAADRWELEDGELDDADIEHWLDSLFTAVPGAQT